MKKVKKLWRKAFSGDNVVNLTDIRYFPRWVILGIDICILLVSLFLSAFVYKRITYIDVFEINFELATLIIISVNVLFMYIFRTYAGIIRHSSFIDLLKILMASLCTFVVLYVVNTFAKTFFLFEITKTTLVAFYIVASFLGLFLLRLVVKEFFHTLREYRRSTLRRRVLVLGIDENSVGVATAIIDNPNVPYKVVGFLTQRHDSKSASLLGKPIISRMKLERWNKDNTSIDGVIMVQDNLSKQEMNSWVNLFLEKDLKIFKVPSLQKFRPDDIGKRIKTLQIEDLLNRKPIKIINSDVTKLHKDKAILVTGGAGSIGSEIVRQVAQYEPSVIVILDQAETPLHNFEMEMKEKYPKTNFRFILGDVTKKERIRKLFEDYHFSVIYHAAAYKHVPLVEQNPQEAIIVNIKGSKNLAELATEYQVNRFVMISTDKAVNPTNVMGATKRVAEMFVQSLQNTEGNITKFITTRFGNVLGSNGSVIPLFKKQIEEGGPITITHPDIVRYFMTIPEACDLVLQAATMGNGGEIFLFDMGDPIKIKDLAERMIKLSGLEPNIDIDLVYTGLRPGEKLYEELLSDNAKTLPTPHTKIMISRDPSVEFSFIQKETDLILEYCNHTDRLEVVRCLKKIVPEYKSNNSIYEVLD